MLKWLKYTALFLLVFLMIGSIYHGATAGPDTFTNKRTVEASKEVVWDTISDVGNYHEVTSDAIADVQILSGKELGMKRACYGPGGEQWTETCTEWVPGSHFTFVVDTKADDYPFPLLDKLKGTWKVEPVSDQKSEIILVFEYDMKYQWATWIFKPFAESQAEKDTDILLDNWERMAEQMEENRQQTKDSEQMTQPTAQSEVNGME